MHIITSNRKKLLELEHIIGLKLEHTNAEIDEIQSLEVEDVAADKVKKAYAIVKKPVIAEDTGLYVYGLGGFPGALVKWFVGSAGVDRLCRLVDSCSSRKAYAKTAIALYDGKSSKIFAGRIEGTISNRPRGSDGMGWDSIFIPRGGRETFAEMTMHEKSAISMRKIAVGKLAKFLKNRK